MRINSRTWITVDIVPNKNASVPRSNFIGVNFFKPLKGVDSNNDITGPSVWLPTPVAFLKIVKESTLYKRKNDSMLGGTNKYHIDIFSEVYATKID